MDTSSTGAARRVACKLCRDRKVKCGGEQPQCFKCKRAGEKCVYIPTQRPTKANLATTVEQLQKRLEEAEAYIARHAPRDGVASITPQGILHMSVDSGVSQNESPSSIGVSLAAFSESNPRTHPNAHNDAELLVQPSELCLSGPDPEDPSVWQDLGRNNQMDSFSVGDGMNIDPVGFEIYANNHLHERRVIHWDAGAEILEPVRAFASTVLRGQAEASVIGALIADYIAWLRKVPRSGGGSVNEGPHYIGILETIEVRVKELCENNQSKSNNALRELVASLKRIAPPESPLASKLESLQDEVMEDAREHANTFRSRYNICALLTEQMGNL